ncbi:para-aminobenzoic acid synthetase [Coprinopsis cinerea okayama7|uniref:aminodeoxychorismate synthase n=1 Tax=Coprinopsis cinerea (strain Okayama-7 / 130 / ATCC MYA-4618 / FGSC 9003) TaxID=240176 RepID=A8N2U7_COPC7|nr:para-aminobenzoic acid synthetase [Coprinopsis cinerea okayama7\|eukprot:XP_001829169.1 para-aminobenzoic acid synthetase [Coprinopsis cinerea okayama7\
MTFASPRILLVDSYDSFTHNLAALCRRSIPNCSVHIIKNDELFLEAVKPNLQYFSAIIVGPGPGSPSKPEDIGIVRDLWKLDSEHVLPIFGVCLGLQSLVLEFGGELKRLHTVKHGQISKVEHVPSEIFQDVGEIHAVRYHSLHVALPSDGSVEELAWVDEEENGHVVMAVKHTRLPFWAVQYHPESVRTEGGGWKVLSNFWTLCQEWSKNNGRAPTPWNPSIQNEVGALWPYNHSFSVKRPSTTPSLASVLSRAVNLPITSLPAVCEHLGVLDERSKFVVLDSASNPGRFSIIGCLLPNSLHITHYVGDPFVTLTRGSQTASELLGSQDIWQWLASYIRTKSGPKGDPAIPFWGGFIGYFSYESGLPTLHVPLIHRKDRRHPDVNLVYVERSIVFDNETGKAHIQSLLPSDEDWMDQMSKDLSILAQPQPRRRSSISLPPVSKVILPEQDQYISKIKQAKEYLYSGDSYELCLTAQTKILIPHQQSKGSTTSTSWERYLRLREKNPAPHSAYIRLHPTTLMSSSPERFLSYSRPPHSVCQLRPIKGTVRKGPGITREVATQLLAGSPKEVAENLMIVDLIRHDLHGVVGDNVVVSKFCGVEEYETVWQLVSVIEGKEDPSVSVEEELGWNVLKASLPPGSMTGAPKKRSVEILQHLEGAEREVYSGVFGYWDIGGGGDWSVTIRSCFKYDDRSSSKDKTEEWAIGAGGAITALSDPDAEWDEMEVKLQSVLKSFGCHITNFVNGGEAEAPL